MKFLYVIHDSATNLWLPPVLQRGDGEAVRGFMAAVSDPQHDFFQYASELRLYKISAYDEDTGRLSPLDAPELILTGSQALLKLQSLREVA